MSRPFRGKEVFDFIQESNFEKVGEFTGIKINAGAGYTSFIPDMGLVTVDHLDHFRMTPRAVDISQLIVESAENFIAIVNTLSAFQLFKLFMF